MPAKDTLGRDARLAADAEWDLLTTSLIRLGIIHLAPERPRRRGAPRTASELFARLFRSSEPRLHQATVFLLLTHPQLAASARTAVTRLAGAERDRAIRRYLAAAALQRMARTRIEMRLGPRELIPPCYLEELGLPSLDQEFGRAALLAIAKDEQARYGYNAWATYRALLDLFLAEIRRRDWGTTCDDQLTRPA
jgi:hypothetical protein